MKKETSIAIITIVVIIVVFSIYLMACCSQEYPLWVDKEKSNCTIWLCKNNSFEQDCGEERVRCIEGDIVNKWD